MCIGEVEGIGDGELIDFGGRARDLRAPEGQIVVGELEIEAELQRLDESAIARQPDAVARAGLPGLAFVSEVGSYIRTW